MLAAVVVAATAVVADELSPLSSLDVDRLKRLLTSAVEAGVATQAQYEESLRLVEAFPCTNVDSSLSAGAKRQLEFALSAQTGIAGVEVYWWMRHGDWTVVYSNAGFGDPPYFFYSQDALAGLPPVAVWAGAGPIYHAGEVAADMLEMAPGIPPGLADCFAWKVMLSPE